MLTTLPLNGIGRILLLLLLLGVGTLVCGTTSSFAQSQDAQDAVSRARSAMQQAQVKAQATQLVTYIKTRTITQLQTSSPMVLRQKQPVLRVEFRCQRLEMCQKPLEINDLIKTLGIRQGEPLGDGRRVAVERLLKMGIWEKVDLDLDQQPGGIVVKINALAAPIITKVDLEGIDPPPFREEVQRLLLFREGQPWRSSLQMEKAQQTSLQELYKREGYFNSKITVATHRAAPDKVEITITVTKGKEMKLCNLGIRGLKAIDYPKARTIIISELSLLARFFGFVTPVFKEKDFRKGQEALVKQYRELGFYQARIVRKEEKPNLKTGCMSVLLDLEEGVRWRVEYRGNQIWSDDALQDDALFKETGYVDETTIRNEAARIKNLYATRGYPFAEVEWRVERGDRYRPRLTFFVEEGPLLEVQSIEVSAQNSKPREAAAVKELSDQALLESMNTRPFGVFEIGGYLQYAALLSDFNRIESLYAKQGYHGAVVTKFTLKRKNKLSNELLISFEVREGPRAMVKASQFVFPKTEGVIVKQSQNIEDTKKLRKLLSLKAKAPYTQELAKADSAKVKQWYASRGYPMSSIETTCVLEDGTSTSCEVPSLSSACVVRRASELKDACQWKTGQGGIERVCVRAKLEESCGTLKEQLLPWRQVTIKHSITPGPKINVEKLLVVGNLDTDDDVILREFSFEEEKEFDVQELLSGQANLRSLGIFDSVSVEAIGLDSAAARQETSNAALLISVDEGESQYFDFSIGLQGRDLLNNLQRRLLILGEAQYNNNNVLGLAQSIRPRLLAAVDLLQLDDLSSQISTQGTIDLDYLTGIELVYNNPRFLKGPLDIDRLLLTVAPYYLLDYLAVTNNNLQREEYGVRTEIRKNLSAQVDRLFITFGIVGKQVATRQPEVGLFTPDGRRLFDPRRTVGKTYVDITLDRRDSPLNPSKGFFVQLSPQWVSGDALSASGEALGDSFLRMTFSGSVYAKIAESLVFGQGLRLGYIVPLFGRDRPVPDDERYVLGGVNNLRGFPEAGVLANVASYRDLLRGGEFVINTNSELRYPLIKQFNVYGAMFWDVGLLADCFSDDTITAEPVGCITDAFPSENRLAKVRTSAGVGIRYLVADQIPLLLDYAALLNRRPGEAFSYLHFNVGYTF